MEPRYASNHDLCRQYNETRDPNLIYLLLKNNSGLVHKFHVFFIENNKPFADVSFTEYLNTMFVAAMDCLNHSGFNLEYEFSTHLSKFMLSTIREFYKGRFGNAYGFAFSNRHQLSASALELRMQIVYAHLRSAFNDVYDPDRDDYKAIEDNEFLRQVAGSLHWKNFDAVKYLNIVLALIGGVNQSRIADTLGFTRARAQQIVDKIRKVVFKDYNPKDRQRFKKKKSEHELNRARVFTPRASAKGCYE